MTSRGTSVICMHWRTQARGELVGDAHQVVGRPSVSKPRLCALRGHDRSRRQVVDALHSVADMSAELGNPSAGKGWMRGVIVHCRRAWGELSKRADHAATASLCRMAVVADGIIDAVHKSLNSGTVQGKRVASTSHRRSA